MKKAPELQDACDIGNLENKSHLLKKSVRCVIEFFFTPITNIDVNLNEVKVVLQKVGIHKHCECCHLFQIIISFKYVSPCLH